jgi:hypothetical protein
MSGPKPLVLEIHRWKSTVEIETASSKAMGHFFFAWLISSPAIEQHMHI